MTEGARKPVAVLGARHWLSVVADLLKRADLDARIVDVRWKRMPFRMIVSKTVRSAEIIHMVWGGDVPSSVVGAVLLRKRVVWHWIGTDVFHYRRGIRLMRALRRQLAENVVTAHFADSPELAEELADLGVSATVCRLLPPTIHAQPMPMPDTFRVLSYWFDERRAFYGGDMVLAAAREFGDVEFIIAGADGKGAPALPNVRYIGRVDNMERVYGGVSVLVRLPEHDSLSVMVLEALARGRYVVYNKEFPGCAHAGSLQALCRALREIRQRSEPNLEGARVVRERFNLQTEADALRRVYGDLLKGSAKK